MAKLTYGVIKAAAEASGYHPGYISRIVNGHMPWRKCRAILIRILYQNGWEPAEGLQYLRQWLRVMSAPMVTSAHEEPAETPPIAVVDIVVPPLDGI